MNKRSPHTIASRTILIGEIKDSEGINFEVRIMKERETRPRVLILNDGWEKTAIWDNVYPILEVQLALSKNKKGFSVVSESFSNKINNKYKVHYEKLFNHRKLKKMIKTFNSQHKKAQMNATHIN
ncbi:MULTISPECIES: hypothetical protein [Proteus]|uniref:hypothetical protein n=1 Tax=Proteus TaxID=583 RepID=UPI00288C4659|nr:hypothetical protein [Proteus terrae]